MQQMNKEPYISGYSTSQVEDVLELIRVITSTFEWDEILENIVKRTIDLFKGNNGTIFIYDNKEGRLVPEFSLGFNWDYLCRIKLRPGEALSGKAFLKKELILYKDEADVVSAMKGLNKEQLHDHRNAFIPSNRNFQSSMCAPLIYKDKCIGVLAIHNIFLGSQFNQNDLQLLGYVATHAAVALSNSLLYKQQRIHSEKLEKYVDFNERITHMVLNGDGLNRIAIELSKLLSRSIYIFDTWLTCISNANSSNIQGKHIVKISEKDVKIIRDQRRPVKLKDVDNEEECLIGTTISAGTTILGYLLVQASYYPLEKEDLTTIERVAKVIALEMMKNKISSETEKRMRGNLFREISLGDITKNTGQLLSMLGYDPTQSYVCLVCTISEENGNTNKQNNNGDDLIEKFCSSQAGVLIFPYNELFTVLLPMDNNQKPYFENHTYIHDKVNKFIFNLEKCTGIKLSVGVGSLFENVKDLPVSYREAEKTLKLLIKYGRAEQIWTYRSLGPLRFLLQVASEKDLLNYTQEVLGVLIQDHSPSCIRLLETLIAWINNGRNTKKTAEFLYVHINTVIYRLQRIEEILNVSFQNEDDWITVQLAVRLWDTLKS